MRRNHDRRLGLSRLLTLAVLLSAALSVFIGCAAAHQSHHHKRRSSRSNDPFWLNPSKPIVAEERALLEQHDYTVARRIALIASQPQATWFTGPVPRKYIRQMTRQARRAGKVPVFVMYDLPWRGCDQPGGGGAPTPRAYRRLVRSVRRAIGRSRVWMVVEPDALSEIGCLPRPKRLSYYKLIRFDVRQFSHDPNAKLYIDAGHPDWEPARVEARRLLRISRNPRVGFALNVSNFYSTRANASYGARISRDTYGKHFIIDTSRNGGDVPDGEWCNPPDARLGPTPTTRTRSPRIDAFLWVKAPGDSDGTCNGGPPSGFWMAAAMELTSP